MNPNLNVNDVFRRFSRDTAWLAVWLLGGLIFAALAFAVLIPDPGQRMTRLQKRASQPESALSQVLSAAELAKVVDLNVKRTANQVPLGTLTHLDQESSESSSKESHAQTEGVAGSTPSPIFVPPEPSRSIETSNASTQQKDSAEAIRGKAPYQRSKSSGSVRYVDVKKRLIELWHQSLARTEKEKARSWAMFSKVETKKKAAFTVRKQY